MSLSPDQNRQLVRLLAEAFTRSELDQLTRQAWNEPLNYTAGEEGAIDVATKVVAKAEARDLERRLIQAAVNLNRTHRGLHEFAWTEFSIRVNAAPPHPPAPPPPAPAAIAEEMQRARRWAQMAQKPPRLWITQIPYDLLDQDDNLFPKLPSARLQPPPAKPRPFWLEIFFIVLVVAPLGSAAGLLLPFMWIDYSLTSVPSYIWFLAILFAAVSLMWLLIYARHS